LKISNTTHVTAIQLNLNQIQMDNQTRYRVYGPVILSTSLSINTNIGKTVEMEIVSQPITLNVE
jgi:hypothetical protein